MEFEQKQKAISIQFKGDLPMSELNHIVIMPEEMLEAENIVSKTFSFGSIAGCVGKEVNPDKKPGINEDGAAIIWKDDVALALVVDGHYERDATEIILDEFVEAIGESWAECIYSTEHFLDAINEIMETIVVMLNRKNAKGEASLTILCVDLKNMRYQYYNIGDCMVFTHSPRPWKPKFQIGQRYYYQWINASGAGDFQYETGKLHPEQEFIITTDGLIDYAQIYIDAIERIFEVAGNGTNVAGQLIKYGLENNKDDDNYSIVYINVSKFIDSQPN